MTNPNGLRELPPEFDDSAREAMRTKARRTKPDHESMGGMSDEWLANELRMLSRHDLWHEPFCTAARDRIMRLSIQLAEARGIIDALKSRSDETPVLRDVGDAVECDIRITIASDTAVKVEECFKAVDAALDTVLEHHDVAMTMKCETRAALKANEGPHCPKCGRGHGLHHDMCLEQL